ncbi:MAG: class I SAM-dependent DNA methyltransferase [Anaerolineae bacterium]|nr:class I SAM-dependent DNA methyltransferase [Anaerolineae bacterium]
MGIHDQLEAFVAWWQQYCKGDEKGEAQIFLDRFFQAFGHKGALEAGGTYEERVRRKRHGHEGIVFADYVWPGHVLIEMKKRGEDLSRHYDQLEDYWKNLERKPPYALLCNFDEIWIYSFPTQFYDPVDCVRIEDLPRRTAALEFLIPGSRKPPVFQNNLVEVTKNAAHSLSEVFKSLARRDNDRAVIQRFILQCMLALFAEDIGLLPDSTFTRIIEEAMDGGEDAHDLIALLFTMMNSHVPKTVGRFRGVAYFDGGLFSEVNPVQLYPEDLRLLRDASRENWSQIRPAIFGTIFEDSLDKDQRHQIGAHFTSEQDIKRIVDPVIVEPWDKRIEAAQTVDELRALHTELCAYQVLDPACGSGNFLYIAYREMKKLERRILDRSAALTGEPPQPETFVTAQQFWGIDINSFAVELAKVTLMIGKKLAVDELHLSEAPLPLDNLDDNMQCRDALLTEWPTFDACIGNPPYQTAKESRDIDSIAHLSRVREAFPDVPGNADYCVYWFHKAHQLMQPGARAGLVGTNTIRQNYSRIGGLDYIVANDGHIFDAVSSMPWSGQAVVHISVACWSKGKPPISPARLRLYDETGETEEDRWVIIKLPFINSALSEKIDVSTTSILTVNTDSKRTFQGQTPGHKGFVLSPNEASEMVRKDAATQEVIFPYLIGRDLVAKPGGSPSRFVIDFGEQDVLEAQKYPAAYKRIEQQVLPDRKAKAQDEIKKNNKLLAQNPDTRINTDHQDALKRWWLHYRGRPERREATQGMKRYIACSRVTKRPIFELISASICPSDALQTFAFDDDYSFGILQSDCHWQWFLVKGATLKADPAYTPHSVFDTFPWPQNPTPEQVKAIADAARNLHEFRRKRMSNSVKITLRDMYRSLELPGKNPLRDLHDILDAAVLAAYGFDPEGEVLAQLLALNLQVAARIEAGESVTPPGIPPGYPNPADLISAGCIPAPEII